MNIKLPKGMSYLVLAGLAGLVATFTIHRYISMRTAVTVKPTEQVVVADVDIAPGTALAPRMLKSIAWPKEIAPPKSFHNSKGLEGRVALVPITRGEPVLPTKLAP